LREAVCEAGSRVVSLEQARRPPRPSA
jgi:hypothetical protein